MKKLVCKFKIIFPSLLIGGLIILNFGVANAAEYEQLIFDTPTSNYSQYNYQILSRNPEEFQGTVNGVSVKLKLVDSITLTAGIYANLTCISSGEPSFDTLLASDSLTPINDSEFHDYNFIFDTPGITDLEKCYTLHINSDYTTSKVLGTTNADSYPQGYFWSYPTENTVKDMYFIIDTSLPSYNFTTTIDEDFIGQRSLPVVAETTLQITNEDYFNTYVFESYLKKTVNEFDYWLKADESFEIIVDDIETVFQKDFTWTNLEFIEYTGINYLLYPKSLGKLYAVLNENYEINLDVVPKVAGEYEESESYVIINSADVVDNRIVGSATFYLGDYIKNWTASIEIWDVDHKKMYYDDVLTGLEASRETYYLYLDKALADGTYNLHAELHYLRQPWWDFFGGTRNVLMDLAADLIIDFEGNVAINPVPKVDIDAGIDTRVKADDVGMLAESIIRNLDRLNPINYFPFSWVNKFRDEVKIARDYYVTLDKEPLDVRFTVDFAGTPVEVIVFQESYLELFLGSDFMPWLKSLFEYVLWFAFGAYIFKRVRKETAQLYIGSEIT